MKDEGICIPDKTRFGIWTFPFEGGARGCCSGCVGGKHSKDLIVLGRFSSSAVVLLCPTPAGIPVQAPHHRDRPLLATALLPLPTQVLENQWKKGLVGTVSKNLHLLCRRIFPDLSLLHRGLITAQNSLYQSHHCGLSSGT